jgi:arylsulfatase A-like enzyme
MKTVKLPGPRLVLAALACAACGGIARPAEETNGADRPNILFIMTDQQHAKMMSCAGNPWLKTPALDGLARDGIRFELAYCANPVCVPSRTSMATGVMPNRLGAFSNGPGMKIRKLPPAVDAHSLGKVLKRAGYDTFYGGKVHLCKSLAPRNAGYDEVVADSREALPAACLAFMRKKRDAPFFAVASFINPHDICFAHLARNGTDRHGVLALHKKAASLPEGRLPPVPENYAIPQGEPPAIEANMSPKAVTPAITMRKEYDEKAWRINRWIYCRLTEQVDRRIGEILDGLKAAGLEKRTLVLFTSDHGNMDASHRLASKGQMYEESVGVPFLLKYPGVIPPGRTDREHLVSTGLDILPTLCDYAGVERPAHLLGRSLRPLAEGRPVDAWRTYVAAENGWSRMIRSRRYKYCAFDHTGGMELLVDLENDPGELRNLAGDPASRDVLVEHRGMLAEWIKRSDDPEGAKYIR